MNRNEIIKHNLTGFFKRHRALGKFQRNGIWTYNEYCNPPYERPATTYITCAFSWDKTPEGQDFWIKLSIKW